MNIINKILRATLFLAASLYVVGCSKDADTEIVYVENEGVVTFDLLEAMTRTDDGDDDDSSIYDELTLKVYSLITDEESGEVSETLVRRYAPMSSMPEYISLVEGDYKVLVYVGDDVMATFDSSLMKISGDCEFEVVAKTSQNIEVDCTYLNRVVRVEFDETVESNIREGYSVIVMAADSYSSTLVGDESTPQLTFTTDRTGYFLLPEGVSNLSWRFTGEKVVYEASNDVAIKVDGVIENPAQSTLTTLSFSYPKYLEVSESLSVIVDTSAEIFDDAFSFVPQPQITGDALETPQIVDGSSFDLSVYSILDIQKVFLTVDESTNIVVFDQYQSVASSYASFVLDEQSMTSGTLTLNSEIFDRYTTGGEKYIYITVMDSASIEGSEMFSCYMPGIINVSSLDLWNNSGEISAMITGDMASSRVEYRAVDSEEWISCDLTSEGNYKYSAKIEPEWIEGVNAYGFSTYLFNHGIRSDVDYECRLVSGEDEYTMNFSSDAGGSQLTSANMDSTSISCFTTSNTSSTAWGSGNNTYATELCDYATIDSNLCAKLTSGSALGKLTAGNLFYGQFTFNGIVSQTGTARFGQAFTWGARPISFKFRYAATIGNVDIVNSTALSKASDEIQSIVKEGSKDRGRVFFAIVDWSGRHSVTAGGDSPEGTWDPVSQTSTDEGKIIGYASFFIDESTASTSQLYEKELDIYYYDNVTKPTGSISIVVSCASCAYGDFMSGSSSSVVWLDDFELVY